MKNHGIEIALYVLLAVCPSCRTRDVRPKAQKLGLRLLATGEHVVGMR